MAYPAALPEGKPRLKPTTRLLIILNFAFNKLTLHRISVRVLSYNTRAIRYYDKCGFVIEKHPGKWELVLYA